MTDIVDGLKVQARIRSTCQVCNKPLGATYLSAGAYCSEVCKEFDDNGSPRYLHADGLPVVCRCDHAGHVSEFKDGRGIYLFSACSGCFAQKRKAYRPDIFTCYPTDEQIEEGY